MNQPSRRPLRYRAAKAWLLAHRIRRSIGKNPPQGNFRVLLFHDIEADQMVAFERLLQHILENHGVVTAQEAETLLMGQPFDGRKGRVPYLLTFDDGFASHARIARDLLDRYGVKGLFFVCPGLIDLPAGRQRQAIAECIWDGTLSEDELPEDMALMLWSDVEALSSSGHTIGSHSLTHQRLAILDGDEQDREIVDSGTRLEERLGAPVSWFAYPFGNLASIDQRSLNKISGQYQFCCSGIRGMNTTRTNQVGLLREQLSLDGPFEYQQLVLEGGLDFYYSGKAKRLMELADQAIVSSMAPREQA